MPSMEVAIVGEVLALRTDGAEESILPQAKELSRWAITDGRLQLSNDLLLSSGGERRTLSGLAGAAGYVR